jgi:CubicO group peptidase (beta-lactamase class C family)
MLRNRVLLAFALVLSLVLQAHAQALPRASAPENVGLSSARLGRLSTAIQAGVDRSEIPGAVIIVARKGKVAYLESFGFRDREAGSRMPQNAIHRIASMTKPIATVGFMILVEEGKVSLADPVALYLPELKDVKVGIEKKDDSGGMQLVLETPQRAMTVHDLLRHTSGFTYGFFGKSLVKDQYNAAKVLDAGQTSAEFITKLAKIPLQYHPGTTWEYSVSTDVLGRIIEVVSGTPLDQFLAERVLAPLKMTDTGFWVEQREKHSRIAEPQADPATGKRPTMPDRTQKPNWLSAGGGMVSTAPDYARFCQFLLNGGKLDGVRLLSRKTVEYMASDHLPLGIRVNGFPVAVIDTRPENGLGFGLGFAVRTSAGRSSVPGSVGDFGWTGIYGTQFWVDPKEQMCAVMMLQTATPATRNKYWTVMRDLVYQAIVD